MSLVSGKKNTAVAVKKETPLATTELPDYMKSGVNRGLDNVTAQDLAIPRLEIVQDLSPARKKNDPAYIEGAEVGDLINSTSREHYGDQAYIVPIYYTKQWLLWRDQKEGGGFGGAYDSELEANAECAKRSQEEKGWAVMDTPQYLCYILSSIEDDVRPQEIMISMPRTKAKISRQWNATMRMMGGDTFARVYKFTTVQETKNNNTYGNFQIGAAGFTPRSVYQAAEALYDRIKSGEKRIVVDMTDAQETVDHTDM